MLVALGGPAVYSMALGACLGRPEAALGRMRGSNKGRGRGWPGRDAGRQQAGHPMPEEAPLRLLWGGYLKCGAKP